MSTTEQPAAGPSLACPGCGSQDVHLDRGLLCRTCGATMGTQQREEVTCMAGVPVLRQSFTGHMAGGDPIIDHESSVRDWAECGEPAVAVHVYRCEHGHEKRRATCPAHAPQPGQVGCRECYDAGHECGMTASEAGGIASHE